jgi:guanylate kinase
MSNRRTSNFHRDGSLFIVSGPSGAGKTTLIKGARAELAEMGIDLYFSVSHTTRGPRSGERDGTEYHFVDSDRFRQMAAAGEFLEWAEVHDELYGTSRSEVAGRLQRGEDVILDIDVQGAQQIADDDALRPQSVSIFVFPPSFEELEKRLRNRRMNSEEQIELRLRKASDEIEGGCNFYDYVIINDDQEIATACLKAAIVANKLKSSNALVALRDMAHRFKEEYSGRIARGN